MLLISRTERVAIPLCFAPQQATPQQATPQWATPQHDARTHHLPSIFFCAMLSRKDNTYFFFLQLKREKERERLESTSRCAWLISLLLQRRIERWEEERQRERERERGAC